MKLKIIITIWVIVGILACKETVKQPTVVEAPPSTSVVSYNYPSYCAYFPPPDGIPTFELSQDYPQFFDEENFDQPWKTIDFKKDYKAYMQLVLDYCIEGNLAVDFKGQDNKVRKWYNAPWLDDDGNNPENSNAKQNSGREYHHGLTREITINACTLGPKQVNNYQTWAIAYYNEPGGYTIGQVWKDPENPNEDLSDFPEGTVCFKLLLTETPLEEAPYLENSLTWTANIFVPANEKKKRFDKTVRLVQLDIAIKDDRASTGWVYGTFTHNAAAGGAPEDWVSRLVPVGLMWGDDSQDTSMLNITDQYNPSLKQSIVNQELLLANNPNRAPNAVFVTHLGQGGRINGPVDNPISSCISCHARAAIDEHGNLAEIANFTAGKDDCKKEKNCNGEEKCKVVYSLKDFEKYFSEIPCGIQNIEQLDSDGSIKVYQTLDFSFQIANGLRNYYQVKQPTLKKGETPDFKQVVSRDGSSFDLDD